MKRTTSMGLGALLWIAVVVIVIGGTVLTRQRGGDGVHATHLSCAPPAQTAPVEGASPSTVMPSSPTVTTPTPSTVKEC